MASRYLVTGGSGFIGSHLCDRLLQDESTELVVCVDNLQTGDKSNITDALKDSRFHFVEADVREDLDLPFTVDGVFHLASPASPPGYMEDPVGTLLTGGVGTYNVARFALKNNARIVYSSTSEVYGDPLEHPQRETYWGNVNPNGPRSCYDEGKRFGEAMLFALARAEDLNIGVIRIFNTYGPRMHPADGRIVSTFADQALSNEPLTIFGDGLQTRSFCYVSDLVEGLIKMMNSTETGPINLGNPVEKSVLEIAGIIRAAVKSQSEFKFCPLPKDDPTRRRPDISKAKDLLDWEPKVSLQDGLEKCLN